MTRRQALTALAAAAPSPATLAAKIQALEARAGGRLGVCLLDLATGRAQGHRLDERFAMCSTFKLPLAAVMLREADRRRLRLDEPIAYSAKDLVSHSPVTSQHVAKGSMTVEALAEAAQTTSDGVAANLLVNRLGGPAAFTQYLRGLGARATRLDRLEPAMNEVRPGDDRDTTTPRDMAQLIARILQKELQPASKEKLIAWTIATKTGEKRIRAGLPAGWRAGDKTGSTWNEDFTDKYNDVAIVWPPNGSAFILAAYFDTNVRSPQVSDEHQAVLAEVGRIAAAAR